MPQRDQYTVLDRRRYLMASAAALLNARHVTAAIPPALRRAERLFLVQDSLYGRA